MQLFCCLLLTVASIVVVQAQGLCDTERNWVQFGDDNCYKFYNSFLTHEEAIIVCQDESTEGDESSLVQIKTQQEQEFVTRYAFEELGIVDPVWIGAKRHEDDGTKFIWDDGSEVTVSNWVTNSPSNNTEKNCVKMLSELGKIEKAGKALNGQWEDASCLTRGVAMCEKLQNWDIKYLQKKHLELVANHFDYEEKMDKKVLDLAATHFDYEEKMDKKVLDLAANHFDYEEKMNQHVLELEARMNQDISQLEANMYSKIVPVGFLYTELPWQAAPWSIWPQFTWEDVSIHYAGQFFRVVGSGSEGFGVWQGENAPRITRIDTLGKGWPGGNNDVPVGGWSPWYATGEENAFSEQAGLRFHTSGGEVRPKNYAMRLWKRVA